MAIGTLALRLSRPADYLATHEGVALERFARTLAGLKDFAYDGVCTESSPPPAGPRYVVADQTLLTDVARALGIRRVDDFYGGVVPHPLLATKAVAHALVDEAARRPDAWPADVVAETAEVALPGFTVFDAADAERAYARLRPIGPVRLKPPCATGGRDQRVVHELDEVRAFVAAMGADTLACDGLVLETNLPDVRTFSLGQITAAGVVASYYGTQRLTSDNKGQECYGGSDLVVVRGGWDALDALSLSDELRLAVRQTRRYDDALCGADGVLASRRNYDVAQGYDGRGTWRSGVLEHSWRIGGASSAEMAAVVRFLDDPRRSVVRASTVEVYGDGAAAPAGALVVFDGHDPLVGPILCYTVVDDDVAVVREAAA